MDPCAIGTCVINFKALRDTTFYKISSSFYKTQFLEKPIVIFKINLFYFNKKILNYIYIEICETTNTHMPH